MLRAACMYMRALHASVPQQVLVSTCTALHHPQHSRRTGNTVIKPLCTSPKLGLSQYKL
jgi:hypothetical protein